MCQYSVTLAYSCKQSPVPCQKPLPATKKLLTHCQLADGHKTPYNCPPSGYAAWHCLTGTLCFINKRKLS
ncbi:unnamed protein product [Acetobacter orientalis]|uniref:Unnamed protein product n=1 Tax=Acetobacter orientalis TaxID=146474 RepID=A0A2Z5ZKR0_9PROT|nr:unnamed protein product [Acetobacter orientalis]